MDLPDNSIGISDLIAFTECPRKMSYGMRRHVARGEQSEASMPESSQYGAVYARMYGSAIHDVIHDVEDGFSDDDAIQRAWTTYGEYLEPDDLDMMRQDIEVYRQRDVPQARLIASEEDCRVPLFVHPVYGQIYFRFKLDRLYERIDAPGIFIHKDYKSSRHAKSQKDVDEDKQMWSYNWAIHELYPEVDRLFQLYDQLRFGEIAARRKTDQQRALIKEWLVKTATAVLDKKAREEDGLLPPKKNEWCAWCPILESCPVIDHLLDFGRVEIEALAPTIKEGRKTLQLVEPTKIDEYLEKFDEAKAAIGVLERFRDSVAEILKNMPAEERAVRGYDLKGRKATQFTVDAKRQIAEKLGEDFYQLATISKTSLEQFFGEDKESFEWALSLANETEGARVLVPRK